MLGVDIVEKKYTFSQRLKDLLRIFNINQTELSTKTGISKSSISHYLKGDWEGKQDAVYKISTAFGISKAWLMGVDVPMYTTPPAPDTDSLTDHEKALITAYRAKPEMQMAVDTLLGVSSAPTIESDIGRTVAMGESVLGKSRTDTK